MKVISTTQIICSLSVGSFLTARFLSFLLSIKKFLYFLQEFVLIKLTATAVFATLDLQADSAMLLSHTVAMTRVTLAYLARNKSVISYVGHVHLVSPEMVKSVKVIN